MPTEQPDHHLDGSADRAAERTRFLRVLLIVGLLWLLFSVAFALQSRTPAAIVCAAAGGLTLGLRLWGGNGSHHRVRQATQLHQALATLGLFGSNMFTGQSAALGMPFFACVPLAAGYQIGTRAAMIWGGVAGAAIVLIHGLEAVVDVSMGYQIAAGEVMMNQLGIVLVGVVFVVAARKVTDQREKTILAQAASLERQTEQLAAARDDALRAANAKDQFLANMSHEIRTPLNGIIGTLTVLKHRPMEQDDRMLLETMLGSSRLLLQLVNDILDYERIETGGVELERIPFSIARSVDAVVGTCAPQAETKGLTVRVEVPPELPTVYGDSRRVEQVLLNLVGNAVKFTEEGEVGVRVTPVDGETEGTRFDFEVWDTGIGLTEEQQAQVFLPFSQADPSISRKFGGTGLGLAIATQLVELMGGRLAVQSQPGKGSCFSFSLELQIHESRDSYASKERVKSLQPAEPEARGRVLVAEDNAVNQLVLVRMLKILGYDADVVDTGDAAIKTVIASHDYALVLMDCQMPGVDGYTATKTIREHERSKSLDRIPIIAVTAHVLQRERERADEAGMDDYLTKPVELEMLRGVLESYTERQSGVESTKQPGG